MERGKKKREKGRNRENRKGRKGGKNVTNGNGRIKRKEGREKGMVMEKVPKTNEEMGSREEGRKKERVKEGRS
jgi:hypothetical protein